MILLTGGAGYIGSHTAVALQQAGHEVVIVDNLVNSKKSMVDKIGRITNTPPKFYEINVCDRDSLRTVFEENDIQAVIHFASLKAVGESVEKPELYYENNIGGAETLISVMDEFNVKKIVFSSSACVYGVPEYTPIDEEHPLSATNPYGETKIAIEELLRAKYAQDSTWEIALLRYFNPVGAHQSGLIGEDPNGIPNNLAPYICKVITGEFKRVNVFGNDYNTHDGTGVRDYIHVLDLANGHVKALDKLNEFECRAVNLGTGVGYSVLDVLKAFEKANGIPVPYTISDRRAGDVASCFAKVDLAKDFMGWKTHYDLEQMAQDHLNFVKGHNNV